MFFNLAWRNSKRNRSENLIYFLTMVTAVATFYIVLSLGSQDVMRFLEEIESDAVNRLLTMLMPTVYLFSLLFVFFLVIFANKYQLECRSRELGLYLMFGMTKRHLFIQIMAEGLITSLLALLGGLICGGFLSEVISLATARLVGRGIIAHQSSFSVSAVLLTTLGFLMIQVVALFILCGKLFNKEIHQLLYGEMAKKQQVGKMSGNLFSLILGAVVLTLAYWVILKYFMVAGGMMIIVAVILGIVGTMLFIRGLAGLLSAAAASVKRNTTHGLYIFTLRQLHENIVHKYISIGVASILIMLTIMLIADGSTRIMSYGNQMTRGSSVYDFTVTGNEATVEKYLSGKQMQPYVADLSRRETGTMKQGATSYEFSPNQPAALNLLGCIDTTGASPFLIPVSSYNELLEAAGEKTIVLGIDEAVFYLNPDFQGSTKEETTTMLNQIAEDARANGKVLISIDGLPITLIPFVPMKGLTADENVKIITALIVSDEVYSEYVNPDTVTVYHNFCIPSETVEADGLMVSIMEARDLLKPSGLYCESYLDNFGRQLFYVISGSYTTLYMGFMLLIIACALLALQFLTQMRETKARYATLSILGARREQMKRSINQQVLWYFLLPLFPACISGTVGICAMQHYLYSNMAKLQQSYPMLLVMALVVVCMLALYGVAIARTANREISKLNWKPNA